jgi:hypothetical protein
MYDKSSAFLGRALFFDIGLSRYVLQLQSEAVGEISFSQKEKSRYGFVFDRIIIFLFLDMY